MCIEESIFRIRFSPEIEIEIVVCPRPIAIKNSEIILEEDNIDISENQIGLYHRLGTSYYFYRWNY